MGSGRLVDRLSAWLSQNEPAAGYLQLCIVNYAQILLAYAQDGVPFALEVALKARLDALYGVDNDDVLVQDYFVLVRFEASALEQARSDATFPENLCRALSYAPVQCGGDSALLNLRAAWFDSAQAMESGLPAAFSELRAAAGAVAFTEAEPAMPEQIRSDMASACRFFRKLQNGGVVLSFQPVMSIRQDGDPLFQEDGPSSLQKGDRLSSPENGHPLYYEALLRCAATDVDIRAQDEEGGLSPDDDEYASCGDIVASLERLHLVERLDASVLWTVLRVLRQQPGVHLGCNLSALSLRRGGWWQSIFDALRDAPGLACRLTLEITETACIVDVDEAFEMLQMLRDLGCRIALDDMEAGFNTLDLAGRLRPDIIKLDKNLMHAARVSGSAWRLGSLVDASRMVCSYVVAEGVESVEDMRSSLKAGAHAVQGFFVRDPSLRPPWLSAPVFVDDFFKPIDGSVLAASVRQAADQLES
ncbi:EAL domain-containing protein [Paracandidimonas soli]|uniref:EAL domain-containing protein n=1 Tax=Paracandidimonas soli TaxID=1917182 RepID=UPI00333E8A2B